MNPELQSLLRVQSLDQRIASLEKDIAALPKHIEKIEKTLDSRIRKVEADRAALAANQRERKKLDGDIQTQQQKITKLRGQTLEAKNNEQYRAFQHEIEFCEKEIRRCEDRVLELMTESEPLDAALKRTEEALKEEKTQVEIEKNHAKDKTAKDKGFVEEAKRQRQEALAAVNPKLVTLYERIRKKWGAKVVADATEGRCSACNMLLRPQFMQDLKLGDQVLQCESCGRILYYNAPVNFEAHMQSQQG